MNQTVAGRTNRQGLSALIAHDLLPGIVTCKLLHISDLVHLQLGMLLTTELANACFEARNHVALVLVDDLARLEVDVASFGNRFLPEAAVIEEALTLSTFCVRKTDAESPVV